MLLIGEPVHSITTSKERMVLHHDKTIFASEHASQLLFIESKVTFPLHFQLYALQSTITEEQYDKVSAINLQATEITILVSTRKPLDTTRESTPLW